MECKKRIVSNIQGDNASSLILIRYQNGRYMGGLGRDNAYRNST